AEAQVIVVATGLDSAAAPEEVPGDRPEILIRWQVKRVLKGELGNKEITTGTSAWMYSTAIAQEKGSGRKEVTTRTRPSTAEFIGKEWIIFLTPDFMAGKDPHSPHLHIQFEPTVKSFLGEEKK